MDGGTYVLELALDRQIDLEVGALGTISFEAGRYAYVGSALGPGGFARIARHREVAAGERDVRHWHIDYLLPVATLVDVNRFPGREVECEVARRLDGTVVEGFGASDCGCDGHLVAVEDGVVDGLNDELFN